MEKFEVPENVVISQIDTYGYGAGECGMEFFDQNNESILKIGRFNSDQQKFKIPKDSVWIGAKAQANI